MSELIEKAIEEYQPKYVVGLFSGGHDSLTACHVALPYVDFMCHINTGIGIEETRQFVRDTCKEWGVELREYKATENTKADGTPDPQIYRELVLDQGFPGAFLHTKMYNRLKERQLARMRRELGVRSKDIMLITGVREDESKRRTRHVQKVQIDNFIWVAPIWNFTKRMCNDYIAEHNIKRNMVVDLLHMSGECLCGAYAHPGELEEIRGWYPHVAEMIDQLEEEVREAGFPWGWEEQPPKFWTEAKKGQMMIEEYTGIPMLCVGCDERRAMLNLNREIHHDKTQKQE